MNYKIKIPKTKDLQFIQNYFSKNNLDISNLKINPDVIPPNFLKLYVLHELVNLNKRISVLEIGSGWSSLFLGNAFFCVTDVITTRQLTPWDSNNRHHFSSGVSKALVLRTGGL